ncbi:DMT family transporter [Alcaligenes sp. SDU_A2]|uniref:DMT family transporter n=1 Tax=Alcaligenes sp. SDU_A2 TaxID=3136634 RepID=UPI00311E4598
MFFGYWGHGLNKGQTQDKVALLLMGLVVLTWGMSWVVMKAMTTHIGPVDLIAARYGLAFVFLWGFMRFKGLQLQATPWKLSLGVAVFQTVGFQLLSQFSLQAGGAGKMVALAYTMPFWIVVFSWPLLGERPQRRHVLGMFAALGGLLLIIAPWQGMGGALGAALAALSGVSWGLGAVLSKMLFQRHRVALLNATVWQCFLGMVIVVPLAWLVPQRAPSMEWPMLTGVLFLGVVATGVGWLLWMAVMSRVSAAVAGMSSLGVPALTIVLAWLILGEQPTALELAGTALILLGLLIVNWPSRQAQTDERMPGR